MAEIISRNNKYPIFQFKMSNCIGDNEQKPKLLECFKSKGANAVENYSTDSNLNSTCVFYTSLSQILT